MKNMLIRLFLVMFVLGMSAVGYSQETAPAATSNVYEIDPGHSSMDFAVKHLQVSTVRGGFTDYSGTVAFDPNDYATFSADLTIQSKSINTKVENRDTHLRGPDFFDVEKFPTITFKSNRLEKRGEGAVIVGNLTIKDVTKELTIPVTISGPVQSPMGSTVIGLSAQTKINRQDFNVTWNKQLDNGGFVVGDDVDLIIDIEAGKK